MKKTIFSLILSAITVCNTYSKPVVLSTELQPYAKTSNTVASLNELVGVVDIEAGDGIAITTNDQILVINSDITDAVFSLNNLQGDVDLGITGHGLSLETNENILTFNSSSINIEQDIDVFDQNTTTIDLSNINKQYFNKTDFSTGTNILSIPNPEKYKSASITIYAKELPTYDFWYDFNDENIAAYPSTRLWLTDLEDAVWKFNFSHAPGVVGWKYEDSTKYTIVETEYVISDEGVVLRTYPQPKGELDIPSEFEGVTITGIGDGAFQNNTQITKVSFPDTVETIGENAFAGCSGLIEIDFGSNIKTIGENAFTNCDNVNYITYIRNDEEFDINTPLTRIKTQLADSGIDPNNPSIDFEEMTVLDYKWTYNILTEPTSTRDDEETIIPGTIEITGSRPELQANVVMPKEVNGYTVVKVANSAFQNKQKFTRISFPETLKTIGQNSFYGCSKLKELTILSTIDELGHSSFYNCSGITNLVFEPRTNNLNIIDHSFHGCSKIPEIIFPEGVTSAPPGVCHACTSMTNLVLPDSLSNVEWEAFRDCTALKSVTLGTGYNFVYIQYSSPFRNDTALRTVTLRGSFAPISTMLYGSGAESRIETVIFDGPFSSIRDYLFNGCTKLTNIVFNNTAAITNIGSNAFKGCTVLPEFTIPDTVETIGEYAFNNCKLFSEITIPESVERIEAYTFAGCTNLSDISLHDNINYIGDYAFSDCKKFTEFTIPDNVETVGAYAFNNCINIQSFNIPTVLTNLDTRAFTGCSILHEFDVSPDNTAYSSTEGILYSKDETVLKCWPLGKYSGTISSNVKSIEDYAFNKCINIKNITLPEGLLNIGNGAFDGCTALVSMPLPNGITNIGEYAFNNCSKLVTQVPGNVSDIKQYTFNNCKQIKDVTIPATAKFIETNAFANCTALTNVSLENGITNIATSAFDGCTKLASIDIPDSVESIGQFAFRKCTSMKSVGIGSGVKNSDQDAFINDSAITNVNIHNVTNWCNIDFNTENSNPLIFAKHLTLNGEPLTNLEVPNTCAEIKQFAFKNCDSLENIIIPNSITNISKQAFQDCNNLQDVTIPESVVSTGEAIFYSCDNLTNATILGIITGDYNYNTAPFAYCNKLASIDLGTNMTRIGNYIFYNCNNLLSLTIPPSITNIGERAFMSCQSITNVDIPETLQQIGYYAFSGCYGLKSVNITNLEAWCTTTFVEQWSASDSNPLMFAHHLYVNGEELTNLIIPDTITNILPYAFYGSYGITNVVIHSNVVNIANKAFGDNNIKSFIVADENENYSSTNGLLLTKDGTRILNGVSGNIIIPENIIHISDGAFSTAHGLESIEILSNITDDWGYGNEPFKGCTNLTTLILGTNMTKIGNYMFRGCSGLESVTIPDNITSIGSYAFYECGKLASVETGNGVTSINTYAFYNCTNLTNFVCGNSVKNINTYAFYNCYGLTNMIIGDAVTDIGNYAFWYCYKLTDMVLGNAVKTVGNNAFNNCTGMERITIPKSVTSIFYGAFSNCTNLTTVYYSPTDTESRVKDLMRGKGVDVDKLTYIQLPE